MRLYKRICKNPKCKKEFLGTRTQQYCCPDCRVPTGNNKYKRKIKTCTIGEVARQANALGMSYGKYVAMQYQAEKENE
jgi:hypothetical protein